MAIILNNPIQVQGEQNNSPDTTTPKIKNTMPPRIAPGYNPDDHHILVVNGKEKKVSKKSAYLLDMLIVDDE
jgi:hypothetical protein